MDLLPVGDNQFIIDDRKYAQLGGLFFIFYRLDRMEDDLFENCLNTVEKSLRRPYGLKKD